MVGVAVIQGVGFLVFALMVWMTIPRLKFWVSTALFSALHLFFLVGMFLLPGDLRSESHGVPIAIYSVGLVIGVAMLFVLRARTRATA